MSLLRMPAEPKPEWFTIIRDNRETEGTTWDMAPMQQTWGTLPTFDFAIKGAEHCGGIERKELGDLLSCMAGERERFERELTRMLAYPFRAVIVEATWQQLEHGGWRSKVSPESAIGSVLGWQAAGIPFLFPGNHEAAQKCAARMLFIVARRQWRLCRALAAGIVEAEEAPA
jgi:DNA excision repair protein ERCC-4